LADRCGDGQAGVGTVDDEVLTLGPTLSVKDRVAAQCDRQRGGETSPGSRTCHEDALHEVPFVCRRECELAYRRWPRGCQKIGRIERREDRNGGTKNVRLA